MKKKTIFMLMLLLLFPAMCMPVAAGDAPYTTYTYSYSGDYQVSPDAFLPTNSIQHIDITEDSGFVASQATDMDTADYLTLKDPYDISSDSKGNIYIADTGNNRIVILDANYHLKKVLSSYPKDGTIVTMNAPQGLFVGDDNRLYVADTGNGNLVEFAADYSFNRVVQAPSIDVLPEDFTYTPTSLVVDSYNRFYVICSGTDMGIITFDQYGIFKGFIGAEKVIKNPADKFWQSLMSEEQLSQLKKSVPSSYNNIAIDSKGFVYVTSSSIGAYTLKQIINSRSTSSTYMPIKKLNPSGTDVLKRNGFFAPVGDLNFDAYSSAKGKGPSAITEITVLDNDVYSVVDSQYNKIFTYDEYGNLLYVFGTSGKVDGTFDLLQSITYQNDNTLITLDRNRNAITVFEKTEYGKQNDAVINLQRERKFSETVPIWQKILKSNNNYDLAYMGIGKALLNNGNYQEAMNNFQAINNKEYYSKAFKKYRAIFLKNWAILILIVIILAVWLILKFFRYSRKYNTDTHRLPGGKNGTRTVREEFMYGFYVMFHPFDGFWDLKHERRGGMRGATLWLILGTFAMVCKSFLSSYLMIDLTSLSSSSIISTLINVFVPFLLWCIANWCLTALMDGKGTFRDIYIATSYALVPLVLLIIPFSLISNVMILEELSFVTYAINLAFFLCGSLIFVGSMVTHDYSLGKNVLVCSLTIVGMGIILFLAFLFVTVVGRFATFISNIVTEISFRL